MDREEKEKKCNRGNGEVEFAFCESWNISLFWEAQTLP